MSAAVAEPMLEAELWISFASLLRSYFAAATLDRPEARIDGTHDSVVLRLGATWLIIVCNPEAGTGAWRIEGGATHSGEFTLLQDGRIALDGNAVELDHAAIDLVTLAVRAGKEA